MSDEDHLRHARVHRPRDPGEEALYKCCRHVGAGGDFVHPAEWNHALRGRQPHEAVPADPEGEVQLLWRGEEFDLLHTFTHSFPSFRDIT